MKISRTQKWVLIWVIIFTLIFSTFGAFLLYSNSVTPMREFLIFQGHVTDAATGAPIQGASVVCGWNESVLKVYSDATGQYSAALDYDRNVTMFECSAAAQGYRTMYSYEPRYLFNITQLGSNYNVTVTDQNGKQVKGIYYGFVIMDFALEKENSTEAKT